MSDEATLIRRCLDGDENAAREFVERFQSIVFSVCYRMLGQREDAEDVAQDVFVRAFRSLRRWDPARPLKPWILAIAANRCRTTLMRRARHANCGPVPEYFDDAVDAAESLGLAQELDAAIGDLRDDYRQCFVLFYQENLSCAEIASAMECPVGTVKTWLHRARRELAEHLRRRGIGPYAQYQLHGV